MKTHPKAIVMVLISTVFISFAQIFFKSASFGFSFDIVSLFTNYNLIAGILIYMMAAAMLLVALKKGELMVLYPMIASSYIWVSFLSPMFFPTDQMTLMKWTGIFLIISGVTALSIGGKNG
jgi:undecaprenyl phosphate-alpha-L-ara4N flippase subunit ArnE